VGVGTSASGLEAFTELLKALADGPGNDLCFDSHLDAGHKSSMPYMLSRSTQMKVEEA
jgi:chemotaxis response regulator CheB